jgi:hypothetical protein
MTANLKHFVAETEMMHIQGAMVPHLKADTRRQMLQKLSRDMQTEAYYNVPATAEEYKARMSITGLKVVSRPVKGSVDDQS